VVGDINGQYPVVFKKLEALHGKNAFAFALVVGNLFADPAASTPDDEQNVRNLINGITKVALPTYFGIGTHGLPQPVIDQLEKSDGELCPNLFFLGKRTTTKTSEGVRIIALGGSLDASLKGVSKDKYTPYYSEDDSKALRGANQADILVTSQWPSDIRTGSKIEMDASAEPSSQKCLSDLAAHLKPRYYFSTSPAVFYEREPFFHPPSEASPDAVHITRFLSLAAFGNTSKQKWIYAFSIDPTAAPPVTIPPGTQASPLLFQTKKRAALPDQNSFRFSSGNGGGDNYSRPKKRQRGPPPSQSECFFCLSNPNLATHLIASIGTEAYLTTAKGPLSTSSTYPSLEFPGHILIIPMAHAPTLSLIPDAESRTNTTMEMHQYRNAMQEMLTSQSKEELGAVTYDISRSVGFHSHWQFIPVPAELITKGLVEAAFKVEAENNKYAAFEEGDPDEASDYIRIWIWDPTTKKDKSLWLPLDSSFRDLQYPRRVLAKLLGLENRVSWQNCGQTHEDEVADAEAFKKAFKPFDFTE
jgi:Protein similar to CwfJ C-terminus 1/Protein similar to CwfJ C-terminus 2